jgi:putative transcriptional regulator
MTSVRLVFLRSLLALCSTMATVPVGAQSQDVRDRPVLLAAQPKLNDPVYSQTVIAVAPAGNGWHIGLIINRPTDRSLASLFPEHEPAIKVKHPVHFGGPMDMNVLIALVKRNSSPGADALEIGDGLYLTVGSTTIDSVIESTPDDARFYVGWVVWRPGELEKEIKANYWSVHDADSRVMFRSSTENLWREMHESSRGIRTSIDPGTRLSAR